MMDRYTIDSVWDELDPEGEWVRYRDVADLEAQLAITGKALELAVERLYDFYHHDCDLCPVDYVALCRFGPIRDCWQHIGDQIINEAKEALSDGTI